MSWGIVAEVWKHAQVSSSELFVLITIAEHAREYCRHAWPSYSQIAKLTRLDERSVKRIIPRLAEKENLIIHPGRGLNRQNAYTGPPGAIDGFLR
jgi:hypothetical protein